LAIRDKRRNLTAGDGLSLYNTGLREMFKSERLGTWDRSTSSINASIAARHAGASCSRFGSFAMKLPASRNVRSSPPSGRGDGVVEAALQAFVGNAAILSPRDASSFRKFVNRTLAELALL
jgi:hypothetical protein